MKAKDIFQYALGALIVVVIMALVYVIFTVELPDKNKDVALFKNEEIDYIYIARKRLEKAWSELNEEKKSYIIDANEITYYINREKERNVNYG